MSEIDKIYKANCETRSDINQHLPTLKKYAEECETITEFGVRTAKSTTAFLSSKPKQLISYDIKKHKYVTKLLNLSQKEGINFSFHKSDVLTIDIEETDLLFIDTWHVYDQLIQELKIHGDKAKKYIIMHDTKSYGNVGEKLRHETVATRQGLKQAISEFLDENPKWVLHEVFENNNGLTILKRQDEIS